MSNSLYYGEIAAKISAHLYQNPDQIMQLDLVMNKDESDKGDTIWTICADAARVFDALEDLSDDYMIDWHGALDLYAEEVYEYLIQGQTPNMVELISMASRSIQDTSETTYH